MSRYEYPEDEFDAADDEGPVPVGVHRAPVPGWRSWVPLLAVLIIVPLLAWGAVQLLGRHGARPAAEATARAVGQALGITNIVESAAEAQSNPIVIVLRTDFEE